jgi:hypothetical protein
MHRETRTVSRKTAFDGKLEISATAAERIESLGAVIPVRIEVPRGAAPVDDFASLATMECTCAKSGVAGAHVHTFLACDRFRALPALTAVSIEVDHTRIYLRESDG